VPPKPRKQRLDELLVQRGLSENRSQAQRLILAGQVLLGDQVADKPGRQVLEEAFAVRPEGWVCADVGASTGGFTDCLLQHGAARVYAIDVGYGQLAWRLRQDSRVIAMERANIRYLEPLPEPVALATVDVSFIGLELVLPRVVSLLQPAGQVIALIKPQFEAGREQVGKGGVVRDPRVHRAVVERVLASGQAAGLSPAGLIRSPITGPAGNVEFLAWLRLAAVAPDAATIEGWIAAAGA
jgi:23S rRNA (cytidine1920-2'-O)/16S rRNA (cytidine1409-2'-O)-methyltransferase